jgi:hypothetical protein
LFRALNEEIFGLITELYLQYWLIEEQWNLELLSNWKRFLAIFG